MPQVKAEELAVQKAAEEAQLKSDLALRARGVEGCWLYKQSPKSYSTFFKRWFVYADDGARGGHLRYYKDRALKVRRLTICFFVHLQKCLLSTFMRLFYDAASEPTGWQNCGSVRNCRCAA